MKSWLHFQLSGLLLSPSNRIFITRLISKLSHPYLACVVDVIQPQLITFAKQGRHSCSGPPTNSTNYRKCVSNFLSFWLENGQWFSSTGQSWRVLKSWYTAGDPEQGFRRRFADRLNQSLVSSETQAQSLLGNRKRTSEIEETFKVSVTFTLFASFCLKLIDGKWLNHVMRRKCPFDFFSWSRMKPQRRREV